MSGPLAGVRVLDFTRVLAGPHCTRMLVDMGADVIKVEPPEGDITRFFHPRRGSMATYHVQQNCGKRNISLDLRKPEAVSLVLGMAGHVDVVVENFRPGVMDRMGLGYDALRDRKPRIVYASISGYGPDGPWAGRAAYAATIHSEAGLLDVQSRVLGHDPRHDGFSHADLYASLECFSGVVAALYHRERTGDGQRVDVSMAQALLYVNEHVHAEASGERGGVTTSALTRSPVVRTGEGHRVTIAGDVTARGLFASIVEVTGRKDLDADPRFATEEDRRRNKQALVDEIESWTLGFDDLDELEAALGKARIAMGVVRTVGEVVRTPGAAVTTVSDRSGGTVAIPSPPWRFSATPAAVRGEPAWRGEHNAEVLSELLGLSADEVRALETEGVLSARPPRA